MRNEVEMMDEVLARLRQPEIATAALQEELREIQEVGEQRCDTIVTQLDDREQ